MDRILAKAQTINGEYDEIDEVEYCDTIKYNYETSILTL
jgi:hypothetical protein